MILWGILDEKSTTWKESDIVNRDNGGIINVYKPVGMTSFAVVSRIRRLVGVKKVGHCGTLDPFAEGVLPVCIGRATAAVQYMDQYDKKYRVHMIFGKETDTQDRTGTIVSENKPTEQDLQEMANSHFASLEKAVEELTGAQEQLPPMYSAIKLNGKHLYEYAREGIEIERKKRAITIYDAKLVDASAGEDFSATVDIHCSKGTYIRTICMNLGRTLTFGAYADSLLRMACGPFTLDHCFTIEQIEELLRDRMKEAEQKVERNDEPLSAQTPVEYLIERHCCIPVEFAMSHMKRIDLDKAQSLRIIQGQKVDYSEKLSLDEPLLTFCVPDRFIGITKGREYGGENTILSAERIFVDVTDFQ